MVLLRNALLKTALKILFASFLIYWLLSSGRLELQPLKYIFQWRTFFPFFLLIGMVLFVSSERWRSLLKSQNLLIRPLEAFRMTLIGNFFNFFIPGGVGGDFVKAFAVTKHTPEAKASSVFTVFMDRLVGLYSLILMALMALVWKYDEAMTNPHLAYIFWMVLISTFIFSLSFMILFSNRMMNSRIFPWMISKLPLTARWNTLYLTLKKYASVKKVIFVTFFQSLLAQGLVILFFQQVTLTLGIENIPLSTYLFAIPLGFIVIAIPVAPAGIGIGQAAFYYFFSLSLGMESPVGATALTAYQLFLLIYGLIGALFYVFDRPSLKRLPLE